MNKKNKNKIILKTIFLACLLIFSVSIISSAFAQQTPQNPSSLVPCGLDGKADCTLCHLVIGFNNIYNYLLWYILLPATILVVVVAGVMYMVSSGSKGMIDRAKSALTYALTAMILALLAWLIVNAVLNALGYNKSGSWWTFSCDTTQTQGPTGGTGTNGNTQSGNNTNNAGTGNTGGTGCGAVVANINSMAGSAYVRGSNDCSSTTNRAYTNAGCQSPGGTTYDQYKNASQYSGDASTLKAGDALVFNNGNPNNSQGHVGICLTDGCTQIMGASTKSGIHVNQNGASSISSQASQAGYPLKVIKASDYCPASSC